jgi:hypothetical protein
MGCGQQEGTIMADFKKVAGSCYCGANQFEVSQPAVEMHHCHCSICRRLHSAAFVSFAIFPRTGFGWTKGGDLQTFSSSAQIHRNRCKDCGSTITVDVDPMPDVVVIPRASMPAEAELGYPAATLRHAYWPDHVTWLELNDKLPRVAGFDK